MTTKENEAFEGEGGGGGGGFLAVDQPAAGGHTYVYDSNMSLRRLTIDALPAEENYRKLSQLHVDQRPTMEELMIGEKMQKIVEESDVPVQTKLSGKVVKFGWIEGVFMRCLLNIWGVMLFLRLTWVMGQAGLIQGLLIITLCNVVTGITTLSMSAVATNGQIASGGVYYMISRALGPEFGGAIGIMFTVANSISVATYTIGFCDNLFDLIYDVSEFSGIVGSNEDRLNDLRIIGTPVIILILLLAIVGMDWVTRVQKLLLVLLIFAQIDMFVGTFLKGDSAYTKDNERHAVGFTGWSMDTLNSNIYADFKEDPNGKQESFMSVFGVFFTAVTGIVAGANLSGDLKDPGDAIPKGTLYAIIFTYISYGLFGVMVSFTFLRGASGNVEEITNSTLGLDVGDCSEAANALRVQYNLTYTECTFGAQYDQKVMTYISGTGYLVYLGCYGATLSSAIASLVGAPRVLQAVGKDKIYPKLEFFAKGNGANNDPFRGYLLVFAIAFGCLMVGELNTIGSLASNFFLAAYALMNFSVFHSSMTKSPGWRPSFKFYNKWLSLLGAIICIALMFLMDWRIAIGTVAITALLYGFMLYLKPEISWGSSAEALVFVNALNNSYSLNEQQEHVKTYRPKILLLSGNPAHRVPLVDFGNLLTKKMSLLICAHIMDETQKADTVAMKVNVVSWLKDHGIKSFYSVSSNKSFSKGVSNAISLTGLGKLSPNMVLMGYSSQKENLEELEEYYNVLVIAFEQKLAVGILRLKNGADYSSVVASEETIVETAIDEDEEQNDKKKSKKKGKKVEAIYRGKDGKLLPKNIIDDIQHFRAKRRVGNIDVWWLYDDGGLTLLLPHILQTRKQFASCKLRVFSLSNRPDDFDKETRNLAALLAKFRIDFSEVMIVPDITKKANVDTKEEFMRIIAKYPTNAISEKDITTNAERTNRHLRTAELLREKSISSELIVMTLPLPRREGIPPALYMAWLEIMTKGLPPVLMTRGNQTSVLTYYS